jgi:hypothetical protein
MAFGPMKLWKSPYTTRWDDFPNLKLPTDSADEANFQTGLLTFVDWYKSALPVDKALQDAFVRKFDSLCV